MERFPLPFSLLAAFLLTLLFIGSDVHSTPLHATLPIPTQVTTTGGSDPTISADGTRLAYRLAGPGVVIITLAGGAVDTVTTDGALEPDWSWANGLLLYRGGNPYGLWTYDPDTKINTFLTGSGFDDGAVWAASGDEIIAQTSSHPNGGDGLVILSYPGGTPSYINCLEPDQTACSGEDPTGSPDGQWIAFYDGPVEKVSRNGGTSVYVTTDLGYKPKWSPDGLWIAFVSPALGGFSHISVTDSRGSDFGFVQLTDGDYTDSEPTWSPNSNEIYFCSDRSGATEIWKVAFDPGTVPVHPITWGRLKAHSW